MKNKNKKDEDSDGQILLSKEMKKCTNLVNWSDGTGEYFRKTSVKKNNKPVNADYLKIKY